MVEFITGTLFEIISGTWNRNGFSAQRFQKTDLSVKCWNIIKSEYLKIENYWKPTVLKVLYAYHRGLWIMFCKITSIIIPFIFLGGREIWKMV